MGRVLSQSNQQWAYRHISHIFFDQNQFTDVQTVELQEVIKIWNIFCKLYETVQLINSFKWKFICEFFSTYMITYRFLYYICEPPDRFDLDDFITIRLHGKLRG